MDAIFFLIWLKKLLIFCHLQRWNYHEYNTHKILFFLNTDENSECIPKYKAIGQWEWKCSFISVVTPCLNTHLKTKYITNIYWEQTASKVQNM